MQFWVDCDDERYYLVRLWLREPKSEPGMHIDRFCLELDVPDKTPLYAFLGAEEDLEKDSSGKTIYVDDWHGLIVTANPELFPPDGFGFAGPTKLVNHKWVDV